MRWVSKKGVKHVLAGIGAVYAVWFLALLVRAALTQREAPGPSELELHPERHAEIRAWQRAEQLQGRLGLSDEQTRKVAEIFLEYQPMGGRRGGGPGNRFEALQDEIAKVLTPEQQALQDQMRPGGPGGPPRGSGAPGGPGGPGGRGGPPGMDPERMETLKQAMTEEQRERFEKQLERMRQRMPMGPGGPGQQSPPPPM